MRRVGKSMIFLLYIDELIKKGISKEQIIYLNFEEKENDIYKNENDLYNHIISHVKKDKMLYVFLDEIQEVKNFEKVIDSLFVKLNIDVYITGYNAKFLSSEIATLLTGRYIEINVLPLSFKEYYTHYKSPNRDRRNLFNDYISYGGMPGLTMFEKGSLEQQEYIESIYKAILEKDILKRNTSISKQLVEHILSYLLYSIGCLTSTKRISDYISSNVIKVSYNTIDSYFSTLLDCFMFYKVDRYDIVGKEYLKLINKYYVIDFGFKYYLLNNKALELPQILENLIFLELKRRRYKIATGKVNDKEVDFIIKNTNGELRYIQVAVTIMDENKLKQKLRPFKAIHDNYPKYIITLDDYFIKDHEGIKTINALDFLLGEEI